MGFSFASASFTALGRAGDIDSQTSARGATAALKCIVPKGNSELFTLLLSISASAARSKKTWIPAYAGMTTRKKSRLLVDEFRTPRLVAEGRSFHKFGADRGSIF